MMTLETLQTFWEYREWLRGRFAGYVGLRAAEPGAHYPDEAPMAPLNERLLQTIWAQQMVETSALRLADGRPLHVIDPGRWNGSAGPDFAAARLMLDGATLTGDVELHLAGDDWQAHGHHRDLDYNGVIVHVVLRNEGGRADDPLHNGGRVPRLELEPYIFPDLETVRRSISADDFNYAQPSRLGRCQPMMAELDTGLVADFLDKAGNERLIAKTRRLEEQLRQLGGESPQAALEQVFYQACMMSLGAGATRTLYYLLARRTPLREMCDHVRDWPEAEWPLAIEALLIHVAGLAPGAEELGQAPPEARERARRLAEAWSRLEPYWRDRLIPPTRRWQQGIRPVNFPTRRLAGMAVLIARAMRRRSGPLAELLGHIRAGAATLERAGPRRRKHPLLVELIRALRIEGRGHFWGGHYSFRARPAARTMDLIGEGAALSLVLNAVLPATLMAARACEDESLALAAERLFGLVPPLQDNHITTFMARRLFGDDGRADALLTTERRRQALFQIFYHCCTNEERDCESCYYLREG